MDIVETIGNPNAKTTMNEMNNEVVGHDEGKLVVVMKRNNGPVDLDESATNTSSSNNTDDGSNTTSVSYDESREHNNIIPEQQRLAALTRTMGVKQREISEGFRTLIKKVAKYVYQAEHEDTLDIDAAFIRRRKIEVITEQANHMAMKQERIAEQFESLVFRLERDNIQKDIINQKLKRRLQLAQLLLKEHGIEYNNHDDDIMSETYASTWDLTNSDISSGTCSALWNQNSQRLKSYNNKRWFNTSPFHNNKSDHHHHHKHAPPSPTTSSSSSNEIFAIKEICIKIDDNEKTTTTTPVVESPILPNIIKTTTTAVEDDDINKNNSSNTTNEVVDEVGGINLSTNIINTLVLNSNSSSSQDNNNNNNNIEQQC